MLSRRNTLILLAGAPLAGCAAVQGFIATQLQQDLSTLAAGLGSVEKYLGDIGITIPAGIITEANTLITQIQANIASIENDLAPNQTVLQEIASAVNLLATLLTPFFPMAGGIATAIQAALALIGFILSAVGVTAPPAPTPAAVAAMFAAAGVAPPAANEPKSMATFKAAAALTEAQARAILQQAAKSGIQ